MDNKFKIVNCSAQENYILKITFADGETGFVDLAHLVGKGVFSLWNNINEFKKVSIDPIVKTVCWEGEIDLDPITIREHLSISHKRSLA
ncbi:MAG: DUF2442 domain-containing protein [Proteobacteria bacterium]|nr:DUF2442 domain-containing protein [Pseudomonadota bacterium]